MCRMFSGGIVCEKVDNNMDYPQFTLHTFYA
jgi:hypothetical protein